MSTRRKYSVPFTLVVTVGLLLTMTFAAGAAPPGNERFTATWGGGDAGDQLGEVKTYALIWFSTNDQGDNMWVDLDLSTNNGYHCWFNGPATSWNDDTDAQQISIVLNHPGGVAMEGGEPGQGGSCGDALTYAEIVVDYSGADTSKWHTNRTGSQCRGNDVTHLDAHGSVVIETVDEGRFGMDGDNEFWHPNYYTSEWRCHSTGTPGNPNN